ncbi:MAG TPA: patatin-like phospholipase family protein [Candidatus Sulfotelmatobacter sp.]|nr:patatin-like phospholipase family protein [Candidatus Sulfotelmatobacter sp.]
MSSFDYAGRRGPQLTIFFLILLSTLASAQDPLSVEDRRQPAASVPAQRPRIGLALSGGGALGLAQIGVIQWLEENHIPIDRIAGTSMGSIIGVMYATGMSPAEMQKFAQGIDWNEALLPEPDYRQLSYRRKQDRRDYQVEAALGVKHGLRGPNGFDPGLGVGLLLDRITFAESRIASFDDLPIPFRCVATDMQSGDRVVLHDGSLPRAVRASMAIPGVFTPVQIDGRVLADGGMVENIPVEVAREMDADKVIAIDLQMPLGGKEELETITGVLSRAVSVMILQNERQSLKLADAIVTVDTGNFSMTDYDRVSDLIRLGYKSAANHAAALLPYAIQDDAEWQKYLIARNAHKRPPPKEVQSVTVEGGDSDTNQRIEQRLKSDTGVPLNLSKLETQLTRIAGQGEFDRLGYEGFSQDGVPALRVTAHEKTYGPPFVDLAVNVDGSGVAAFDFSAGARITFMDVEHHGGEWRNDLMLGSSNLAASEFYQPIANTHFFMAPYAFVSKEPRNAFEGQTRVAVFGDERAGGGFDFGYDSGRRSELRFGYEIFSGKLAPLIGSAGLPVLSGSTGEFRTRYVWDGQDSPAIPSAGTRIVASLARVLQSPGLVHPIDQLEVQTSTFIPTSEKTSLFLAASGGTTFHGTAGEFQVFSLGGSFRLGAYLPSEFVGNHYGYSSFGFRRELYRLPQLVGKKVYWGGWYEAGSAFNNPDSLIVRGSLNAGFIADTIVGPIAIFGSVSPTGKSRVNFSIGRLF